MQTLEAILSVRVWPTRLPIGGGMNSYATESHLRSQASCSPARAHASDHTQVQRGATGDHQPALPALKLPSP